MELVIWKLETGPDSYRDWKLETGRLQITEYTNH